MRLDASIGQLKIRRDLARFFIYAFLIVYSLACLFPFLWSIMSSFKASDKILVYPFQVPTVWKWQNYREAWVTAKMALYFWNTAVYAPMSSPG
jgi:raffinose/stachyose/melibiose transport system permease protein